KAAEALLTMPDPPSAIFASNDDMAAGVLAVAHKRGVVIPDQLSVAGFDDTVLAQVVYPPLTTIRQPTRTLGKTGTNLLFSMGPGAEHRRLPHELIERQSTRAIPLSRP
ncbi:MAG: substrate-binding domain-containing protein, partial [Sphingobium sp.]